MLRDVISISANGANTGATFYQSHDFTVLQDAYAIRWRRPGHKPNARQQLFLTAAITKTIYGTYEWTNKAGWTKVQHECISLPLTPAGDIDFGFMERTIAELEAERIAELEAYLQAAGLENCELTPEERKAVAEYSTHCAHFKLSTLSALFDHIAQGRRLKKEDQLPGNIPFVMSGTTNNGVVGHVANPVATFPANALTIDIFGNAFYRPYAFGAGDDTGVYWRDAANRYPAEAMLFLTASAGSALRGKYDYGHKLRSSQSEGLTLTLPLTASGTPDVDYMCVLMRAVEKLVVAGVAEFATQRIADTRTVASQHHPTRRTYTPVEPHEIARAAES